MPLLDNPGSSLTVGRKEVTTAGTRVQLSTDTARILYVVITAETNNTNPVTIGGTGVVGALLTREGTPLAPGDSITLPIAQLSAIWLDAITNTEGVTFTAIRP